MTYVDNRVYDNGLTVLTNETTHLYICSQEAATYEEATSTYVLGVKESPTISSPSDRSGGGRKVTISAITDGTCTEDGVATHYSLVDSTNNRLLISKTLTSSGQVQDTFLFKLSEITIGIPGPI
jgi:hypothetical protein